MKKIALMFIGLICVGSIHAGQKCSKNQTMQCVQCSGDCAASNHVCAECNNAICARCENSFLMSADIYRSNKKNSFFVVYACCCGKRVRLYANQDARRANIAARVLNNGHRFEEVYD